MIKAVFFDIDGTLFSHRTKQIPQSTRDSLQRLRENGVLVFISTGRHRKEIDQLPMDGLTFDGYVTINGQLGLDADRRTVYSVPFSDDVTRRLVSLFADKTIPLTLTGENRIYINFVNERVRTVQQIIHCPVPEVRPYDGKPVYQASVFVTREEEAALRALLPDGCMLSRWHESGADIISLSGGKEEGIRRFMQLHGLQQDEVMAFGDADNDRGMLEFAGVGVAMGNADEAVKQTADYVTADIDADGVAAALRHFGLI